MGGTSQKKKKEKQEETLKDFISWFEMPALR